MKKIFLTISCVLSTLIGFFIPFGIHENFLTKNSIVNNMTSFEKIRDKANWNLGNSYSAPASLNGRKTIKENVRQILGLNENYDVKIVANNFDTTKAFNQIEELPNDILNPHILLDFSIAIGYQGNLIYYTEIDNEWILDSIIQGKQVSYQDLFLLNSGDFSDSVEDNLNNYLIENKDFFEKNIIQNQLGSYKDFVSLFSSSVTDWFRIDSLNNSFSIESDNAALILNKVVQFPNSMVFDNNKFIVGNEHKYLYLNKVAIDDDFFHRLFNLEKTDSEWNFEDSEILGNTKLLVVKEKMNLLLSEKILKSANLDAAYLANPNNEIFKINFYKDGSSNNSYSDNQVVSDMWGMSKGKPYTWVYVSGLKDEYKWLENVISFSENYGERFWADISFQKEVI